jgi:hypothetical protein
MLYIERNNCRISDSKLETVLDLGTIYPSTFVKPGEGYDFEKVPLELCRGTESNLVQLRHTVDRDSLYRQYWYKSQLNNTMVHHLQDIVDNITERISIHPGDVIIDIGCNDGIMLSMFPKYCFKIGIDPANNLKTVASGNCTLFVNDYFSKEVLPPNLHAKIITSIAMFYDLDNPRKFIEDILSVMDREGTWVIQMTDLFCMLRANAFDNIVHEHLEYYSLDVLMKLLSEYNLFIWDIQYNLVNGGSVRLYISRRDSSHRQSINVLRASFVEDEYLRDDPSLKLFKDRIESIKSKVVNFIRRERDSYKSVYGLGASTKGNTLLQYFGLDHNDIIKIAEINPDKYGLETIGSRIPIVPNLYAFAENPDYFLILPWHFAPDIISKCKLYMNKGMKFIVPCPEPMIIGRYGCKLME